MHAREITTQGGLRGPLYWSLGLHTLAAAAAVTAYTRVEHLTGIVRGTRGTSLTFVAEPITKRFGLRKTVTRASRHDAGLSQKVLTTSSGADTNQKVLTTFSYGLAVRTQVEEKLEYPLSLRRRGIRGRVALMLSIAESGALESVDIAESSGRAELDENARRAAREAAPFPAPGARTTLRLPIDFRLD